MNIMKHILSTASLDTRIAIRQVFTLTRCGQVVGSTIVIDSGDQLAMLCNNVDNFYLTDEQLEASPSRQDGIDAATEATLRHYGAELIQRAGILLGCDQAVMVTGQVLLQRFYCKKSLKEFNIGVRHIGWIITQRERSLRSDRHGGMSRGHASRPQGPCKISRSRFCSHAHARQSRML